MNWFNIGSDSKYDRSKPVKEETTVEQIRKIAKEDSDINMYRDVESSFFGSEKDQALYRAYLRLYNLEKENAELKGVIGGNREFYGQFQERFNKLNQELEIINHHLELEKQAYQKLYMQKRDLEAKLYAAGRELEIRGYYGKDLT